MNKILHGLQKRVPAIGVAMVMWQGATAGAVDFNREIRPLLSDNCFHCHGPDSHERKAGLRLDTRAGAIEGEAINLENPGESELLKRIRATDESDLMPPPESHKVLTGSQKDLLEKWVREGAVYEEHWAFVPPVKPQPPQIEGADHPIDQFVLKRLREAGLDLSPEAAGETLIRRATLDLTGLPPTLDEVNEFVDDPSPNAWEKVIDRLLASERFGEMMAVYWLDAARYGDSSVMHADGPRDMWPWRDWVIRSFNRNKPFDEFTVEQLAGDLLPNATVDQKVASGFNRNHATSDEGGAIAEELRVEYVVDRVMTTSRVWMALSMECSQCHDHKYDPISQNDYYRFFAYFNNTKDPGMQTRRGNQSPVVMVPSDEQQRRLDQAAKRLADSRNALAEHKKATRKKVDDWLKVAADEGLPEPEGLSQRFVIEEGEEYRLVETVSGEQGVIEGGLEVTDRTKTEKGLKFTRKKGVEFAGVTTGDYNEPFTMAAWIKAPGNGGGAVFSKMSGDGSYRGFDLWMQGGTIGTHIIHKWPENAVKVVSREKLPADKWAHVVVSYDGSAKASGVKIFINGKQARNKVEKDTLKATILTDATFKIGKRTNGSEFNGEVSDARIYNRVLSGVELKRLGRDQIGSVFAKALDKRSDADKKLLEDYYYETEDEAYQALQASLAKATQQESSLRSSITTSMIMEDNMDKPRMTYVLDRGQYDKPRKDESVTPGIPEFLGKLPEGAPDSRLGLARWLTRPDHPLTSRVAVNRLWGMFFGEGLVLTQADFGNQGAAPSHPELLDWLAVDFVEHGWDLKRTIKQMMMSATYRQSSKVTSRHLELDPENTLLSRAPRFRLKGEFIRDQALVLSRLLENTIGGPSVKPYQPPGLWNEVALSPNVKFVRDNGEKLYRRSLYTYWKRSAPHPAMLIFDAPTREKCVVERPRTNTPLQALVTLNDEQFVEASRRLAERVISEGGQTFEERVDHLFRLCTARGVKADEVRVCREVFARQLSAFESDAKAVESFLEIGEVPANGAIQPAELAAWTVLANMILNLDEVLTRG